MADSNKNSNDKMDSRLFKKGNYLFFCIAIGVLDGAFIHNMVIGVGAGVIIGIALEIYMAKRSKKNKKDNDKKDNDKKDNEIVK